MRVELLQYTEGCPRLVAAAARMTISRRGLGELASMPPEEASRWILELVRRGHGSPLEHCSYTFLVECSRVCSHQLVRHRVASYTQHSMRFSEGFVREAVLGLCRELGVDCPERPGGPDGYRAYAEAAERARGLELGVKAYHVSAAFVVPPSLARDPARLEAYVDSVLASVASYYRLLASGAPLEDARYALPASVRTRVVVTMNARELLEVFLPLRMCARAQWELRMVAWRLRDELARVHPEIFRFAGPRCVLADARARGEPCSLEDYLEGRCEPVVPRCPELVPRDRIPACIASAAPRAAGPGEGAG